MGASGSKSSVDDADDKTFYAERETPITFAPGLINRLSDLPSGSSDNAPSSARQSTLDQHIKSRIQAELNRLKSEEEEIVHQVEAALEKENLDKEMSNSAEGEEGKTSSIVLERDVEEITKKVERNRVKRSGLEEEMKASREALESCYKGNQATPLDCWKQVQDFKQACDGIEKSFVRSLA